MNKAIEELAARYESDWVEIPCHNLLEAVNRAYATTGNARVSLAGGDYGQDEALGEVGMGNDDYSIVVWPNGTALLTVRKIDNARFLYGPMVA